MMTDGDASPVVRLFALEQFRIKLGLGAMATLLAEIGDPHRAWRSVHLAGTNGKGSASAMAERALRACGLRTGRYTSPHLARVEERVALDGEDVAPDQFARALARVFDGVDRLLADGRLPHSPTFFEVSTAAAFLVFADAAVEVAVIEVGLGGRFDATNVILPVATAITSIDFDHERHLGTTLSAIAREKAGIAKRGVPMIVGEVPPEAWAAIDAAARAAGAPCVRAHDDARVVAPLEEGHVRLTLTTPRGDYGPVRLGLAGAHQAENALVAVRLLEAWSSATSTDLPRQAVEAGLAHVRWPGRLEWLAHRSRGRVLIDAAHNPAGARALASYLTMARVPAVTLVTSVMADKDVAGVVGPLLPQAAAVVVTRAASPRAMPVDALAAAVAELAAPGTPVHVVPSPREAVAFAPTVAPGSPLLVAGSIYLIGPLRAALIDEGFEPA
jgi:dihydrofolate synthase/folylpolyglutamate synthase